jgi:hypothetical protein
MANVAQSQSLKVGQTSAPSHDIQILISVGLVAIGIVFALYAAGMSSGVSANDLALMVAYP